ncbi:MAG: TPM domain-containing protein [Elusimicrobia bacterium]|nr:TPM domain-containing protein [Elusimicrobiota bacterium]
MKIKTLITLSFLFIISFTSLYSAKLPNPAANSWVSDFAGVMDAGSYQQANMVIQELEQKTGTEIAVVTVKKLEDESIDSFAVKLFEKWGIGKKGKDNGVLLVAAIEDRKVKIEVGYGLEGILPDGLCGEILDNYIVPYFKQGNYGKGLTTGAIAIASVIAKDAGVQLTGNVVVSQPKQKVTFLGLVMKFIFFVIMIFVFIRNPFLFFLLLGMSGGGRGMGGGGFGGGFGGFGGGLSGGGGASRSW